MQHKSVQQYFPFHLAPQPICSGLFVLDIFVLSWQKICNGTITLDKNLRPLVLEKTCAFRCTAKIGTNCLLLSLSRGKDWPVYPLNLIHTPTLVAIDMSSLFIVSLLMNLNLLLTVTIMVIKIKIIFLFLC